MDEQARQEVLDTLDSQQVAWQNKDIHAWIDYFTEDSDFITWRGVWWHSRSENETGHLLMPESIRDQLPNYNLSVDSVSFLEATVALVHASWRWARFVENGRSPEDRCGILTMVLVKKSGGWKIRALQNTRTEGH